jgi:cobaltochelatase CobS
MQISTVASLQSLQTTTFDAGAVFSGTPSGKTVKGYATPSLFTPVIDLNYIFHEQSRDIVVWFIDPSDPLYVYGPSGSGKTSCIKQLAAKLNFPVFEMTGHSRLEFPERIGHHVVRQGSMEFEYGPLALAMKYGGLALLNELDLLEPSTAAGLNGILDGQPLCIPENGGELIVPHPMFRFAATANSNGGSDETGLYQGVLRQNLALMDRFVLCEVTYPKPEAEEQLLEKTAPQLPAPLRKKMVEYANEVRCLFMGESGNSYNSGSIEITFSTRSLLRWADLTIRYQPLANQGIQPVAYALDRALGFRASRETRAMLHELVQRVFPQSGAQSGKKSGE